MHRVFLTGKPSIAFRQAPSLKQRLIKWASKEVPFPSVTTELPGYYKFEHPKRGENVSLALC